MAIVLGLSLLACTSSTKRKAVWATKLVPASEGMKLDPPPPSGLLWMRPVAAVIPTRTAGGKLWDDVGGWPDAFVVVTVNDREVMRTEVATDTLKPKWSHPGGNFEVPSRAELRVDVFDADALEDIPVGSARFASPTQEELASGEIELDIGRRGLVRVAIGDPRAQLGLGFDYMLFKGQLLARQVLKHSPAGRSGMRVGDDIVSIAGKKVKTLTPFGIKSAFDSVPAKGIQVVVLHEGGTTQSMTLVEGPIYALHGELERAE
ncbi:MAG: hypothetical protein JRI68_28435 [Deltaproteobacteria bacterium]|nr:hypothetical protein [Deltaproteobacteria bacterium]